MSAQVFSVGSSLRLRRRQLGVDEFEKLAIGRDFDLPGDSGRFGQPGVISVQLQQEALQARAYLGADVDVLRNGGGRGVAVVERGGQGSGGGRGGVRGGG